MESEWKIKESFPDKVFNVIVTALLMFILVIVLYPMIYVVSSSFSSASAVTSGKVWLLPVDFTLDGYKGVFRNNKIWLGYKNTFIYVISGTMINVFVTICAAYPLAMKTFKLKKMFMFIFTFTMFFSGGLIPTFLTVKDLGLVNTRLAMIVPSALSVYNMLVMKNFFENIPSEMYDAAEIDGCNDMRILLNVVLPLSKSVLSVVTLFYAVRHWNTFFDAIIYLSKQSLYPLQVFLREILVQNSVTNDMLAGAEADEVNNYRELVKYSLIIVSVVPILCVYPLAQKYFIKGTMVGAVKG